MSRSGSAAIVVAIDGPAGVGKSTVARRLARELGLSYLDTGAMYRALGWKALREGRHPEDAAEAARLVAEARLELVHRDDGGVEILLDGEAVEPHIRSQEVGEAASRLAAQPVVRRRLVELQRAYGEEWGAVMEGRDIGTVVFPGTPHKFFLDARPEIRLARRVDQLARTDRAPQSNGEVARELQARDRRDRERTESPLTCDETYQQVDTSDLSLDEVVARLLELVRARGRDGEA